MHQTTPLLSTLLLLLASAPATAQAVHVVDVGGGGNFVSVQAAVDAAAANDIIEIRPGVYDVFVCSKPLRIQGEPGVVLTDSTPFLTVEGIGPNEVFSLSQIEVRGLPLFNNAPYAVIQNCGGLVMFDDVRQEAGSQGTELVVSRVRGLLISDSVIGPIRLTGSTASLTNTSITSSSNVTGGAFVRLENSTMDLTDGAVQVQLLNGGAGFELTNSELNLRVVHGLAITTNQSPFGVPIIDFDIRGNSVVRQHTSVTPPNPTILGGPFFRTADMTTVRTVPAGPGGTLSIDLTSGSSTAVWLFLAAPITPYGLPGVRGDLFVGNNAAFILNLGLFTQFPGTVNVPVSVSPLPIFQGYPVVVQGLDASFAMTNANGFTLH